MVKKILFGLAALIVLTAASGGAFVMSKTSALDESLAVKYDVPIPTITVSTEPSVLARGKHLTEALGGCQGCHGENLGGGKVDAIGPLGTFTYPNITPEKSACSPATPMVSSPG